MGYRVSTVTGSPEQRRAIASFLASFVRDGELLSPRSGDDTEGMWERRMGWWWDENPYVSKDSPRGFLLEHDDAGIVGFSGLIPFDYELDGETVPTLVTTTFFVREGHRSAVMGMLSKQRALAKHYQIIDGSPSPEMRRLLGKLGYRSAGDRAQYFFPTGRGGGAVARTLLRGLGWSFPLPTSEEAGSCRIITDPGLWDGFVPPRDGRIHRRLDSESLGWLSRVGSEKRTFFGLLDVEGKPVAHAIGVYKRRSGMQACLLLDHREYSSTVPGMPLLLRKLIDDPASGLDPATGVIVLSLFGHSSHHGVPGRRVESILHYQLPPAWQNHPKYCLPVEGDLPLL